VRPLVSQPPVGECCPLVGVPPSATTAVHMYLSSALGNSGPNYRAQYQLYLLTERESLVSVLGTELLEVNFFLFGFCLVAQLSMRTRTLFYSSDRVS